MTNLDSKSNNESFENEEFNILNENSEPALNRIEIIQKELIVDSKFHLRKRLEEPRAKGSNLTNKKLLNILNENTTQYKDYQYNEKMNNTNDQIIFSDKVPFEYNN